MLLKTALHSLESIFLRTQGELKALQCFNMILKWKMLQRPSFGNFAYWNKRTTIHISNALVST